MATKWMGVVVVLVAHLAYSANTYAQLGEVELFFELNDTDGDLGIHSALDGAGWQDLTIVDPNNRQMLTIDVKGRLRDQGLTQLAFESTEPPFDVLDPAVFFERFPEGTYDVTVRTLSGRRVRHEAEITHVMPAPPAGLRVNTLPLPEDCDEGPVPSVFGGADILLEWDPVEMTHEDLGAPQGSFDIEIVAYEVFVDQEDFGLAADRDPEQTSLLIPAGLLTPGQTLVEVLAQEESHNQTATESCFQVN